MLSSRYSPHAEFSCKEACPVSASSKKAAPDSNEQLSLCTLLVDSDRKFIDVSGEFCKLTGYSREQLVGTPHENLIAPGTADAGKPNDPFTTSGCSEGLWLLVTRASTRILVHYESHLRTDNLLEIMVSVVGAGY